METAEKKYFDHLLGARSTQKLVEIHSRGSKIDICKVGKQINSQEFKAFIKEQYNAVKCCWLPVEGLNYNIHTDGGRAGLQLLSTRWIANWNRSILGRANFVKDQIKLKVQIGNIKWRLYMKKKHSFI